MRLLILAIVIAIAVLPAIVGAQPSGTLLPADEAFTREWAKVDADVASGAISRTWTYGPSPIGVARESYVQSTAPGGRRLVQYWDKARMEITYPDRDSESSGYVTNGLLVVELITGRIQKGDNDFVDFVPADVPVAGDLDSEISPTYMSFSRLTAPAPDKTGQPVKSWLDRSGGVVEGQSPTSVSYAEFRPETGHNIVDVFSEWMNSSAIFSGVNPIDVVGLPVAEAYWAMVPVAGVEKPVLMQPFERRVLTYTPDNDPAWQVEWGNVGAAYLLHFKPDYPHGLSLSPDGTQVAFIASPLGNTDVHVVSDSGEVRNISQNPYDEFHARWLSDATVLFNGFDSVDLTLEADLTSTSIFYRHGRFNSTPSPNGQLIAYNHVRKDGTRPLMVTTVDGSMDASFPMGEIAYLPVWSGDSGTVAYIRRDAYSTPEELFVWRVGVQQPLQVVGVDGVRDYALSPDGTQIAIIDLESHLWIGPVAGPLLNTEIEAGEIVASPATGEVFYTGDDRGIWSVGFDGENPTKLTSSVIFDLGITVSGQGDRIAFRRITLTSDQIVLLELDSMRESVLLSFN